MNKSLFLDAAISKNWKRLFRSQDCKKYQRYALSNKETEYLGLALSQVMEKVFTQKIRNEEFDALNQVVSNVAQRSKESNLSEAAQLMLQTMAPYQPSEEWKLAEPLRITNFELEPSNIRDGPAPPGLRGFLKFLLQCKIETKLTNEVKLKLIDKLEVTKQEYHWVIELEELLKKLYASMPSFSGKSKS